MPSGIPPGCCVPPSPPLEPSPPLLPSPPLPSEEPPCSCATFCWGVLSESVRVATPQALAVRTTAATARATRLPARSFMRTLRSID